MRLLLLLLVACAADAAAPPTLPSFRAPAVPLVVLNPYMSVWQAADRLTDAFATHWSGPVMAMLGLVRVQGKTMRFMGLDTFTPAGKSKIPAMTQVDVRVHPTRSIYTFSDQATGLSLNVTFTTPSFADNSHALQRPWGTVTFAVACSKASCGDIELYYHNTAEWAVRDVLQAVEWSREKIVGGAAMKVGTSAQKVLGHTGDGVKIDWGYQYVVVPAAGDSSTRMGDWKTAANTFVSAGTLSHLSDDTRMPRACADDWPALAAAWSVRNVTAASQSRMVVLAYDEVKSMEFFGKQLAPFWSKGNTATMVDEMNSIMAQPNGFLWALDAAAEQYDTQMEQDLVASSGRDMAAVASLAHRQITGATTWTVSPHNVSQPWFFMKEISSDGDVSTVDVLYPASPLFLIYNPEAMRLLLVPILEYANNQTSVKYNLAWAPHHLGTWPVCNILPVFQEQMPMEESGNMLLMLAAIAQRQNHDVSWLKPYLPLLTTWGNYLVSTLPDPPKQLCTDDFLGESEQNVNLAAKGILGLAALAMLLTWSGDGANAAVYHKHALAFAAYWQDKGTADGDHFRRQFNLGNSTWSMKYNLFFQKVLAMDVFPETVFDTAMDWYTTKQLNKYGVPLADNVKGFSLLEYQGVLAALGSKEQAARIGAAVLNMANDTDKRVPLTDWYYTQNAKYKGFKARPTLGDLFARLLLTKSSQTSK